MRPHSASSARARHTGELITHHFCPARLRALPTGLAWEDRKDTEKRGHNMNSITYLIGLVVVVALILYFLGVW